MPGTANSLDSLSSPSPSPEPDPAPSRAHAAATHTAAPHSPPKGRTQGPVSASPALSGAGIPEVAKESSGSSRHQRTPSNSNNQTNTVASTSGRDGPNNISTSKGRQRNSLPPAENHHQYNSSTASAGLDSDSELSELTDEDQDTTVTSGKATSDGGRGGRAASRGGTRSKNDHDSDTESTPNGGSSWRTPAPPLPSASPASTSESPKMPPPTTTRKKRSSIVPAPMWGWASTKPIPTSNPIGSSHSNSSSSSSSSQSAQHAQPTSSRAPVSQGSGSSSTTTRGKGVEEEEEEEIAGPPRAFEEEEEEEDGSEHGAPNTASTSGSHPNHGGRRGKAKADRGHAHEERWANGTNTNARPGSSGSGGAVGKRKGAIAAAVAIRKVFTAAASLGEEEEDEQLADNMTGQGKTSRTSKAKGHQAHSVSEDGEEEGEIKEGVDLENEEREKLKMKEKKGGRQSRRSPKGPNALNKGSLHTRDIDANGDDTPLTAGKPRSSARSNSQRAASPASARASVSISRTTSRSASLAPPALSTTDDTTQGTSRAEVSPTPQPSDSAGTPAASTKDEGPDVEMGDAEDIKESSTPDENTEVSNEKSGEEKGAAPIPASNPGPKRRNGNGGHKGRKANNSRDIAEEPAQADDEQETNEDADDETKNTTEADDVEPDESKSNSPEGDVEPEGEGDNEGEGNGNDNGGDAAENDKEQDVDVEVEVEVEIEGEDEGEDEIDNDNEQEPDNEVEVEVEPEQENEPDLELEIEPENENDQEEGDENDEVGMDVDNDLQPAHRAEALDVLARLELKYALLREQIYIEKMDFLAWEEGLLNESAHPEQLHILRELSRRKDKRLELAAKKKEYELASITRKRKMDEYATWSWWKLARDELETDMISETNRKRRRLERDRRAAERPQPVRRIPPPPQVQDLPPAPSLRKIVRSLTNSSGDSQNSNKRDALNSDRHREPRSYPDLSTLSSMDVLQDLEFFNMHRRDSHLRHALGSLPPPLSLQPSHSQGLHIPFGHHPQQPQPGYDQYMDVPGGYATIGGNRMPTAGPSSSAQVIGQPPAPFSHHGTPVPQPNPSGFAHFAPTQGPNSGRLNPPPPGPPLPQPLPSGISHSNSSTGPGPLHGHEPRNQLPGPPPTDVQHPSLGRNEIQEMSIMTGPPHTRDGGREGSYYPSHSQPPPPKGGPGGYLISSGSHPTRRSISPVGLGPGKQGLERSWNGPGGFPVDGRGRDIIMMDDEERYLRERDRRERDRERDREQREMQDLDLLRMRERESYQHRPAGSLPPFPHHQHPQNGASGSSTPHLHHHHRPTPHHHHHVVHHHPQQSPPGGTHNHPMPLPRELDGPRPHSGPSHSLPPPPHPTEVINLSSSKPPSGPPGPSSLPGPGSAPSHWKDDNYATGPQEYREGRNKHRSSTGRPSSASSLLGHPPHDDRDRPMAMPFVMGPSHTMQSAQPSRQESSNSSPRAGNWNEDGPYRSMPPGPPLSHHPSSLPPPGPSGYLGPHDGPHGHTLSPTLRYANPPSGSSGPGRSLPPLSSSQPPTPHQNSVGLSPPRNRPLHTPTSPPPASSSSGYPPPNALHRSPRYGPLPPPLRSPQSGLKMSRPSSPPSSLTSKMLSGPLPPPGSTSTSGSPLVQGPSSMHQGSASGFSSPRLTGPGGPGRATPTGPGLALPPPLHAQPPLGVPLDLKGSDHPSGIGPYPPPPPSKLGLGGSRTGSPMVMSSYPPVGPISPTASRGLAMGPGGSGMSERDRDRERERDSREKERERERDRDRERPLSPPRPLPPPPSSSAKMSVPQMVDGH